MVFLQSAVRPGWDDRLVTALRSLIDAAGGLVVFASGTGDRVPASLINAGLIEHPGSAAPCLAHVAFGDSRRAARLATAPASSLTVHDGRRWLTVEGTAQVVHGPWDSRSAHDDPALRLDEPSYAELLRQIFRSAGGGEHPDWADFDLTMRRDLRVAVLVDVQRLYGYPEV